MPFDESADQARGTRAEVGVRIWSTGQPGVSIAELEIRFESPPSGDHWYVVASGDWSVAPHAEPGLYCKYGEGRVVDDRIRCAARAGNPAMEFRVDQELGNFTGKPVVSDSVVDFKGYDRERVTVVSGSMPPSGADGENVAVIWLPIATPSAVAVNGDELIAFPPIAWLDSEWGSGPPLSEPCNVVREADLWPDFIITRICVPTTYVNVTSATVDSGIELGIRAVEYAAPDTVSDNELRWSIEGGFPGARALVRDPFAQADESWRAFVAALLLSGGVSFALLFVERLAFHSPGGRSSGRATRRAGSA